MKKSHFCDAEPAPAFSNLPSVSLSQLAMISINIRSLLWLSAIFRAILIVYGEWQDCHMEVRYTDVDYLVFSDAASLMASGDSPYLGMKLLAGNYKWVDSDLLVGVFIHSILKLRKVPEDLCMYSVVVWLFNPFTFTIGTRGNCEPIVVSFGLMAFVSSQPVRQQVEVGNVLQAAFWYGLVVHFRIYPIIYVLPIILILDPLFFRSGLKPRLQNWSSRQDKTLRSSNKVTDQYDLWKALKTTVAFVAFNKVVTAQYFVWFFCLLPLILPWSNMKLKWEGLSCILVWIGAQLHWLMWGYLLEFKGKNVFLQLWLAGLLFLAANTFVLIMITCRHTYSPVFQRLEHPTLKNAEKNN
ncbi:hypothetical protein WN943_006774 [Citrus x changshan-huyou]